MAHFISHPERAITLIDSAVITGTLTPQRAQYLKAIVVYNGLQKSDSCLAICRKLLSEKVWESLPDSADADQYQVSLYSLMATASYTISDFLSVERYAQAGIRIAHGNENMRSDEADMTGRLGITMVMMGETEEGFRVLDNGLRLSKMDNRWSSFLSYLNISKKIITAYNLVGRYEEVCDLGKDVLNSLEDFRKSPHIYEEIPSAMLNDTTSLSEFIEYYRVPLISYIASAYAHQDKIDSTIVWYQYFRDCPEHDNPTISQSIIYPLIVLGKYDEASRCVKKICEYLDKDTINARYISLLEYKKTIDEECGNLRAALLVADRIKVISDSLNKNKYNQSLANASVQYKLYEERLRCEDAVLRLQTMVTIIIMVVVVVLFGIAITFIVRIRRGYNKLSKQFHVTKTELEMLKANDEESKKTKEELMKELYLQAEEYMITHEPYKNPDYSIDIMAKELFSNRSYLSEAINRHSGMSFRNWLAKHRIECAKRLLLQDSNARLNDIHCLCGFDAATSFYRQFKKIEGMTPMEWIKKNEE